MKRGIAECECSGGQRECESTELSNFPTKALAIRTAAGGRARSVSLFPNKSLSNPDSGGGESTELSLFPAKAGNPGRIRPDISLIRKNCNFS